MKTNRRAIQGYNLISKCLCYKQTDARLMSSQRYEIRWYGPFKFHGTEDDSVFTAKEAEYPGIYLWTIPFKKQYLVYYVGETGRSFDERFVEHTQNCLNGLYRIYDPSRFAEGAKVLVWDGMWKKEYSKPARMQEFMNRYLELAPVINKYLRQFRIFVAPLDAEERIRQRIEGAIADRLREQLGIIGDFQDSDIRYRSRRDDEKPFSVKIEAFEPILGLCSELLA